MTRNGERNLSSAASTFRVIVNVQRVLGGQETSDAMEQGRTMRTLKILQSGGSKTNQLSLFIQDMQLVM